ncbi:HEPN domain-containing protein, partial [bacterium]|nr:HEPN domain-containing protein [bacterium]
TAKALLLLELDEIPSSHGGVVGEFGKLYIRTERIEREIGRRLNKALDLRNKARYVYNAEISALQAEEVLKLAEKMIQIAPDYMEKSI